MPARLSLLIPGLCGPLPAFEDMEQSARPLVALLKRCRRQKTPESSCSELLAALFGVEVEQRFPYAALSLLAYDIEPGERCWLHADPVNLLADMDRAILSDSQTLKISRGEAEQLVQELNAHFSDDGFSVLMADQNNWYISQPHCELDTTPLHQAVGRNINHLLPRGDAAAVWKRVSNEMQMLLHGSAVNLAREQRGLAPINSLWLWGEGVLPQRGSTDLTKVYSDDPVAAGLARLHHIHHSALTDPIELARAMQHQGHSLAWLDQVQGPCNYGDTSAWLDAMLQLVADWLEPLMQSAKSLDADLDIYPCNGLRYHFSNNNKPGISKLMFWKKDHFRDYVETQ